ncbi:Cdk-activating kinase assembly factor [Parasponia andersonii]|uniref:Cdk-activating kinase assembly factor n=1 Tax=Parasponia andersonii TaxID=3476 RepID=A0A2P5C6Q0_PARAD|nr:Cdk-activating kinase assembly factor [Parasponia andersonii]
MNSLISVKLFVSMLLLLVIASLMLIQFFDHRRGPMPNDGAGEAELAELDEFAAFPFQLIEIARLSPPERCAICRRRFRAHHRVTSLPRCRHIFHPRCIRPWFDAAGPSNGNCPLCRRSAAIESDTSTSDTSPDAYSFVDSTAATDGSFTDPDPFISPQLSSGEEEDDSHNHRSLFEIDTVTEEEGYEDAAEHSEADAVGVGAPGEHDSGSGRPEEEDGEADAVGVGAPGEHDGGSGQPEEEDGEADAVGVGSQEDHDNRSGQPEEEDGEADAVGVGSQEGFAMVERDFFGRCFGFIRPRKIGADPRGNGSGESLSHVVGEGPQGPVLACFPCCRRVFKPRNKFGVPGKEGGPVINEKTKVAFRVFSATSRGDGEWGISEDSGLDSTSSGSTGLIREHFDGNRMPETCVLPKQDQQPGARGSYLHKQNPNRRRCNLEQFVTSNTDTDFIDFSVTEMKNVLRDVIMDIARYYYSERCHGNVSPKTITVIKGDRCYGVLETPVTGTRPYDYCKYGIQEDIYALGCVIYFCITKGNSPFLHPQYWKHDKCNRMKKSKDWSMDILAEDLVEAIFASFPSSTLSPNDVEQHPFFWLESEKNRMLVETSDFLVAIHNTARYGVSLVELSKFQNDLATIATSEVLPDKEWFHKIKEVAQIKDGNGLQTLLKEYRNCFTHLANYPRKTMAII